MNPFLKRLLVSVTCLAAASLLQGCFVAAVGAGVGAVKYGSAKQREAYATYRTEMERLNLEREKSGLKPASILTYEEWAKGKK